MEKNPILEELSDKVRHGIPIDIEDAIAVIWYQQELKRCRKENTLFARIKRWFKKEAHHA